jgi:hypothetical protein
MGLVISLGKNPKRIHFVETDTPGKNRKNQQRIHNESALVEEIN